jgi:hypothetical protein
VDEHAAVIRSDLGDPLPGSRTGTMQVSEFSHGPPEQMWIDPVGEEADQQGFAEAPIVVAPTRHDAVDHRGDFSEAGNTRPALEIARVAQTSRPVVWLDLTSLRGADEVVSALLVELGAEAIVLLLDGSAAQALERVAEAEDLASSLDDGVTALHAGMIRGRAALLADEHGAAIGHFRAALTDAEPSSDADLVRVDLAEATLRDGQVDAARDLLAPVLAGTPGRGLAWLVAQPTAAAVAWRGHRLWRRCGVPRAPADDRPGLTHGSGWRSAAKAASVASSCSTRRLPGLTREKWDSSRMRSTMCG